MKVLHLKNINILKRFRNQRNILSRYILITDRIYDITKQSLSISKECNDTLIGNPLVKKQNQLIELKYLLKLHELNCGIYQEEVDILQSTKAEISQLFIDQLQGLIYITEELISRHYSIKNITSKRNIFYKGLI